MDQPKITYAFLERLLIKGQETFLPISVILAGC